MFNSTNTEPMVVFSSFSDNFILIDNINLNTPKHSVENISYNFNNINTQIPAFQKVCYDLGPQI
jgi:hypothetical protein